MVEMMIDLGFACFCKFYRPHWGVMPRGQKNTQVDTSECTLTQFLYEQLLDLVIRFNNLVSHQISINVYYLTFSGVAISKFVYSTGCTTIIYHIQPFWWIRIALLLFDRSYGCWASGAKGVGGLEEVDSSCRMAVYAADLEGKRVEDSLEDVTNRYRQLKAEVS